MILIFLVLNLFITDVNCRKGKSWRTQYFFLSILASILYFPFWSTIYKIACNEERGGGKETALLQAKHSSLCIKRFHYISFLILASIKNDTIENSWRGQPHLLSGNIYKSMVAIHRSLKSQKFLLLHPPEDWATTDVCEVRCQGGNQD